MDARSVTLTAIANIPLVEPGDDLCSIIAAGLKASAVGPADGDVIVVAQKIVSKAEGRYVDLAGITPSARAAELGRLVGKDPRLVEVILSESSEVVRHREGVLIVAHRLGFVMANAGVDQSNLDPAQGSEPVLLLPKDPDASCEALKAGLDRAFGARLAVVINDSFGRPWRNGAVGVALGAAGLPALRSLVGAPDLAGRPLRVTEVALADEIASAASLVMGEADEGLPVVHLRGLRWSGEPNNAARLIRAKELDLFR